MGRNKLLKGGFIVKLFKFSTLTLLLVSLFTQAHSMGLPTQPLRDDLASVVTHVVNTTSAPVNIVIKDANGTVIKSLDNLAPNVKESVRGSIAIIGSISVNGTELRRCSTPGQTEQKTFSMQGSNDTIEIMKNGQGAFYLQCKLGMREIFVG